MAPRQTELKSDRVELPTSKIGGSLIVEVRLNDAGPFRLLVDSGATTLAITHSAAERAGLKLRERAGFISNAGGEMVPIATAWVGTLECGDFALRGLTAMVVADSALAKLNAGVEVPKDGVIGMAALQDVLLEIDFPRGIVSVVRHGTQSYPADRAVAYSGVCPVVALDVAGKAMPALVDTGYNGTISVLQLDGLPLRGEKRKSGALATAVVGPTIVRRTEEAQLAGEVRLGPVVWVDPDLGESAVNLSMIGVGALSRWKVAFDQRARRLYLLGDESRVELPEVRRRDARFDAGFYADVEDRALRLLEVDEGGAADLAGLRVGDLVTTINGLPAARAAFSQSDHRQKLAVQRNGAEFEVFLVSAPDFSPRRWSLASLRSTLPTSISRNALLVEAWIGETGPYKLVLTTGRAPLQIGQHVVDAAGLKNVDSWLPVVRPDFTPPKVVWVDAFRSGGLELKGMAAVLMSEPALASARSFFGSVDGFLGLEPFKDVLLEMDFPKRQVSVSLPGKEPLPDERAVSYRGSVLRVVMEIAGQSLPAVLDSAVSDGFRMRDLDALPLVHPKIRADAVGIGNVPNRGERGQIDGELRLGPIAWVKPPVFSGRTNLVGNLALSPWRLVIDQQSRQVYFLGGAMRRTWRGQLPPTEPHLRPGYLGSLKEDGLHLVEVDAGGALDRAGLRVGDVVVSVDGSPVRESLQQRTLFRSSFNSRPKLQLLRNGEMLEAELMLAMGEEDAPVSAP